MKRYLDFLPLPFLILTAWEYAHAWSEERAEIVISTQISPPYAYRILIPLLCRFLSKFSGISALTAISLVSIAFSIGLFFVIRSLLNRPWASLLAFLFCECLLFLLLWRMKVYDVPTVFFFALAILLFQRGKLAAYYLLLPIATINRETSFLLILFFAIYFFKRLPFRSYLLGLVYQGIAYLLIRFVIISALVYRSGALFYWQPGIVISEYASAILPTFLLVLIALIFLYLIFRDWQNKPALLRAAFLSTFPVLLIFHFFVGAAFEIRALAEAAPAAFLLAVYPTRKGSTHSKT